MLPLLFNELDRFPLFFEPETERPYAPALDVYEFADHFELKLDVPGFAKADLKVHMEDGELTISGERKAPELPEGARGRFERWSGTFSRSLSLPENADWGAIDANLKDGVLTLTVKKAEAKKPRQIQIN